MAGETEDCINFQAEHLPTGSISFGRFELESLSWERRSSFSHNRYLEEVERYSTPGSVTQKRAILEAHFKKKPLIPQTSFENQSTASFENQSTEECQHTENHLDQQAGCSEEFDGRDDGKQPEFCWYDETPGSSSVHDSMEHEDQEAWTTELPTESVLCSGEGVVSSTYERSDHAEVSLDQLEHDSTISNKVDLWIVDQEPDNKAVIVEELLGKKETAIGEEVLQNKEAVIIEQLKSDVSSKSPAVEKKRVPPSKKKTKKSPLKVKETVEQKTAKIKRTDRMSMQQNLRKSSVERSYVSSGKMLSTSTGKLERESTLKTKPLRQLPLRTPMPKSSDSKNLKVEASINMKAKVSIGNNRRYEVNGDKDARTMKGGVVPRSSSGRSEVDAHRPVNRPKLVADSMKEETRQSDTVFSFKSDERAEKRKEYFMKLEQKLHAKETEMNEIQARTQEEKQAAIKQLRRSLNFKATPMPSFYHEAVPKVAEGKKTVATPAKSQKLQSKCMSPGSQTSSREKSTSLAKATNRESLSGNEPNQSSRSAKASEKVKRDDRGKLGRNISSRKKGEVANKVRRGVVGNVLKGQGIVGGGSVAVHVAS